MLGHPNGTCSHTLLYNKVDTDGFSLLIISNAHQLYPLLNPNFSPVPLIAFFSSFLQFIVGTITVSLVNIVYFSYYD